MSLRAGCASVVWRKGGEQVANKTFRPSALKKRHSKTGEDTKYNGTVLGKGNDHGEILVEGGECTSILMWQEKRKRTQAKQREPSPTIPPMSPDDDSRPPSSALSSLGDGTFGDEMDLS